MFYMAMFFMCCVIPTEKKKYINKKEKNWKLLGTKDTCINDNFQTKNIFNNLHEIVTFTSHEHNNLHSYNSVWILMNLTMYKVITNINHTYG